MINIELWKKPKNVTIIEGFPGFGLVGPITTEFLIDHLKTEQIGQFISDELPATIAVHEGQVVNPMAIHYSKKYNIVILHTILNVKGMEWKLTELIMDIANQLKAKEIISIEGVNSMDSSGNKLYSFGNTKFEELGAEPMKESVIMGVTAALLLRSKISSALFAQAQTNLPDSKAAATIINFLDKYLKMNVDAAPLMKQAEEFETKLKNLLAQTQQAEEVTDAKNLSYLG